LAPAAKEMKELAFQALKVTASEASAEAVLSPI